MLDDCSWFKIFTVSSFDCGMKIEDCCSEYLHLKDLLPKSRQFAMRNPHSAILRRGARVVELAALEMLCTVNRTVGSNPTLSVIRFRISHCGLRNEDTDCEARLFGIRHTHSVI